jgi:Flp pilus assembly secretin CpaC
MLFRSHDTSHQNRELIIFVTPRLVRTWRQQLAVRAAPSRPPDIAPAASIVSRLC